VLSYSSQISDIPEDPDESGSQSSEDVEVVQEEEDRKEGCVAAEKSARVIAFVKSQTYLC